MSIHHDNKAVIAPLRAAFSSCDAERVRQEIMDLFAPDASIRLHYPYQSLTGPEDLWSRVYAPLFDAMPGLERRDFIAISGPRWGSDTSGDWVGLGGNFVGNFNASWLDIPPTDQPVYMRYHEYLRIENGKVVEMEGLWDLGQVLAQAGVWPMAPQLGVEWMCPGPLDGQGVRAKPYNAAQADASVQLVWDMLHEVQKGTSTRPEAGLDGYWHEHAHWYGPTGLGTARGKHDIATRIFKQFREGLSHNTRHLEDGVFFSDGDIVAFTGWPSGTALHSGDGFLGVAPTGKTITRCSLDFWKIQDGLIRECWVMVDVIDLYRQMGVDVFARMRSLNKRRPAA